MIKTFRIYIYINFEDFAFSQIQTAEDMHAYKCLYGAV